MGISNERWYEYYRGVYYNGYTNQSIFLQGSQLVLNVAVVTLAIFVWLHPLANIALMAGVYALLSAMGIVASIHLGTISNEMFLDAVHKAYMANKQFVKITPTHENINKVISFLTLLSSTCTLLSLGILVVFLILI